MHQAQLSPAFLNMLLVLLLLKGFAIQRGQSLTELKYDSRNITFLAPISNHKLVGHVIANRTVDTPDQCQIECFFIAECTSLNFDTSPRASPNCQLSASNKEIKLGDLTPKPGYIYQGSKNDCFGNPCNSSNHTCQSGFGPRGFRCICANCLTGSYCEKYTSDTVLNFPRRSVHQHAVQYVDFPDLVSFTISLWLQVKSLQGARTPFSFENDAGKDEISLIFYGDTGITIDFQGVGNSQNYNVKNISDGHWHHIALKWSQSSKAINIYIDGNKKRPDLESSKIPHNKLKRNLRFALGQEQDNYKDGGYKYGSQSFVGNITAFNMWERVFLDDEISSLAKECPSSHRQGSLLNWPDIVQKKSDALKYFCGLSCEDFGLVNQGRRNQEKTTHACFDNQS